MKLVLIRGHVFNYEEKAPYVPSGLSVLGAVEFNEPDDTLRCHECGEWFRGLPTHISRGHGIFVRDYKISHGLQLYRGGLVTPKQRQKWSDGLKQRHAEGRAHKVTGKGSVLGSRGRPLSHSARFNLVSRCDAQILFRIRVLASRVGHTPTVRELHLAGLDPGGFTQRLGPLAEVMVLAGLVPNGRGGDASHGKLAPLPTAFDARMPWPVDYSRVTQGDAFRRIA